MTDHQRIWRLSLAGLAVVVIAVVVTSAFVQAMTTH